MLISATGMPYKGTLPSLEGPPGAYQTFEIRQRPDVTIPAACHDVGCEAWQYGWETKVDEQTDLGMMQAAYIRQRSGRTFREQRTEAGLTVFRFESHQRCFADHGTIPRRLIVAHGDWRRTFGTIRDHTSLGFWLEDAVENCDRVWSRVANR